MNSYIALVLSMGIVLLGWVWSLVQIVAGEPFDALVLMAVTMFAQIKWLDAMGRKDGE